MVAPSVEPVVSVAEPLPHAPFSDVRPVTLRAFVLVSRVLRRRTDATSRLRVGAAASVLAALTVSASRPLFGRAVGEIRRGQTVGAVGALGGGLVAASLDRAVAAVSPVKGAAAPVSAVRVATPTSQLSRVRVARLNTAPRAVKRAQLAAAFSARAVSSEPASETRVVKLVTTNTVAVVALVASARAVAGA